MLCGGLWCRRGDGRHNRPCRTAHIYAVPQRQEHEALCGAEDQELTGTVNLQVTKDRNQ